MLDPLTTDLSALVLCTPATLATLSLEVSPGSALLERDGVRLLQLVKVSSVTTATTLVQFAFQKTGYLPRACTARSRDKVIGVCGHKELFEQTRHFHGLL